MTDQVVNIHKDIVLKCRKNDPQAQHELYRLYAKAMFNIAMRITNSREDAEDVLQESFTNAFRNIHSYKEEATIGAWLKRIVINNSINHVKKKRLDLVPIENVKIDRAEEGLNESIMSQEVSKVREAVKELPDGYRIVFSLYLLEGYDHKEIAGILGITESTSKSQLNRAKSRLREIMENQVNYG